MEIFLNGGNLICLQLKQRAVFESDVDQQDRALGWICGGKKEDLSIVPFARERTDLEAGGVKRNADSCKSFAGPKAGQPQLVDKTTWCAQTTIFLYLGHGSLLFF